MYFNNRNIFNHQLIFFMNKTKILKPTAMAFLLIGTATFIIGAYAHVWHLLGIPTYWITAVTFIVANLLFSTWFAIKNPEQSFLLQGSVAILTQASILGGIVSGVNVFAPMCPMMAKAMMYATCGMMVVGFLGLMLVDIVIQKTKILNA